jgi:hypothetical protein
MRTATYEDPRESVPETSSFLTSAEESRMRALAASGDPAFTTILRTIERGDIATARHALSFGTRSALDRGSSFEGEIHKGDLDQRDARKALCQVDEVALARVLIASAARASSADRDVKLARLSLTTPPAFGAVRLVARGFVREGAQRGTSHFLATDRRADGSEHLYGIALTKDPRADTEEWCALTRANLRTGCRFGVVTGWRAFTEGKGPELLRENIERMIRYEFHDWADGRARRLDADVFTSGPLADAWRDFLATCGCVGSSALSPGKVSLRAGKVSTRSCGWCEGPIAETRRSHATWCQSRCRHAASRARGRHHV